MSEHRGVGTCVTIALVYPLTITRQGLKLKAGFEVTFGLSEERERFVQL